MQPQFDRICTSCSNLPHAIDHHHSSENETIQISCKCTKVYRTYGSSQPYPLSSYHRFFPLEIDILTGAEIPREWEAVKDVADFTVIDRNYIEQDYQGSKEEQGREETYPDKSNLLVAIIGAKRNIRHESIGQKETKDKTKKVGIIINPRKETEEKQHQCDSYQFQQCLIWMF